MTLQMQVCKIKTVVLSPAANGPEPQCPKQPIRMKLLVVFPHPAVVAILIVSWQSRGLSKSEPC